MSRPTLAGLLLAAAAGFAVFSLAGSARAATHNVAVDDDGGTTNFYSPPSITINVGDTVSWTWVGTNPHTVTHNVPPPDRSFDSGELQTPGSFSHTFPAAGTFDYICLVHGTTMTGSVVVQAGAAPTNTVAAPTSTPTVAFTPVPTTAPGEPTHTPIGTSTPAAGVTASPTAAAPAAGGPAVSSTQPAQGAAAPARQFPSAGSGSERPDAAAWLALILAATGAAVLVASAAHRRSG